MIGDANFDVFVACSGAPFVAIQSLELSSINQREAVVGVLSVLSIMFPSCGQRQASTRCFGFVFVLFYFVLFMCSSANGAACGCTGGTSRSMYRHVSSRPGLDALLRMLL